MAAIRFSGLDSFKLAGIQLTKRELGVGSYASVFEMDYLGLKCAGKKIHEILLRQGGGATYALRRFEEECRLLSRLRHPNIVQFLGVYFEKGMQIPILVMEFLPTNLTSCIEKKEVVYVQISYSILHDVALGLSYLHSQVPPIIHRDLSSNNVLLTSDMKAKISDLGVAKILNLTPLQVSRMVHNTETPGTPAYMPPEAMTADPTYDTCIDIFSYGVLMIHMFSGKWPEPQCGQIRMDRGRMIPVSEAERRSKYFQVIGDQHPLMDLILRCIDNDSRRRPSASDTVRRLADLVAKNPPLFSNRHEMLQHIDVVNKKRREVQQQIGRMENLQRIEMERREQEQHHMRLEMLQQIEMEKNRCKELQQQNASLRLQLECSPPIAIQQGTYATLYHIARKLPPALAKVFCVSPLLSLVPRPEKRAWYTPSAHALT